MIELKLPENIAAVSTSQALRLLEISRSTLGDFKECLNFERPKGWDYLPHQRGFTVQQLMILATLKYLVQTIGRAAAQKQIHNVIEEKHHG